MSGNVVAVHGHNANQGVLRGASILECALAEFHLQFENE